MEKINKLWQNYKFPIILLVAIVFLSAWAVNAGIFESKEFPSLTSSTVTTLLVIGFLAGVLGGLIGTGGCAIMLPALHFWLGYPMPIAVGTTLFAVIFTATSGGCGHLVRRNLDKRATLWLGGFGVVGVLLGSAAFVFLSGNAALLSLILGLAFLLPSIRMIWEGAISAKKHMEGNTIAGSPKKLGTFGFIIGILTGIVGLGGGYALVPGLIYLFGAPVYITMGTSLAVMIPLALVGGIIKLTQGFVALGAGLLLAGGTIVGAQIGAAVIKKFSTNTLKLIFGAYFLYVSAKFIAAYFGVIIW